MAALLPADAGATLLHILVDVLVAHLSLGVVDAQLIQGLVQAEVGHDGGHHRVGHQLAPLLHVAAVDVEDVVAGDDIALFVHAQAAVGVAVVGEAHVQALLHHQFLQTLNVGGAGVEVDIQAVGLCVDDSGVGAQGVKHGLGDVPAGAVGAVQAHLHAPEGIHTQGNQVADVPVAAGDVVHSAADFVLPGEGQLGPLLAKGHQLAVQVVLHQLDGLLVHLLPLIVDKLDAVVVVGVVAGGDHDAAVEVVHPGDVGHGRGGGDVEHIGVRTRGHQASHQGVLEHVAGTAGVLADDDAGRALFGGAALLRGPGPFFCIIPAEETAYFVRVVCC